MKTEITKIHYDKNPQGFLFEVLKFCSIFYGMVVKERNKSYDNGKLKVEKVNAEVISVGNLTTGGVGKTPIVEKIAKYYLKKGEKVAIISRGYGGELSNKQVNLISNGNYIYHKAHACGGEPYWLAKNITGAVVITGQDRVACANFAIENFNSTKIILDDAFQHRRIARDINLLLIDSEKLFGNCNLLPAGPLREDLTAIQRADKIIMVSKNTIHLQAEQTLRMLENDFKKPMILAKIEPDYVQNIINSEIADENEKYFAMSAIGQPEQFYKFLENYNIVEKITFEDHHNYTDEDIQMLLNKGVRNIITTEKDAVKLKALDRKTLNIFALKLKVDIDLTKLL